MLHLQLEYSWFYLALQFYPYTDAVSEMAYYFWFFFIYFIIEIKQTSSFIHNVNMFPFFIKVFIPTHNCQLAKTKKKNVQVENFVQTSIYWDTPSSSAKNLNRSADLLVCVEAKVIANLFCMPALYTSTDKMANLHLSLCANTKWQIQWFAAHAN